jgi:hypothetical protein
MIKEMTKFELQIPENVKPEEWLEANPFNNDQLNYIELFVSWKNKTAEIVVYAPETGSLTYDEYHHRASSFRLDDNVDASKFKNYYDEMIRPIIIEQANKYTEEWNGSNWIGHFESEYVDDDCNPDYELTEIIENAPTHDKFIYTDVAESFQSYEDIVEILQYADIDFMAADLDDMSIVQKIRDYLSDDVVYVMSDEQFQNEIKSMKEVIIENQEN